MLTRKGQRHYSTQQKSKLLSRNPYSKSTVKLIIHYLELRLSKTFEKYVNNLNLSEQSVFSKTTDNIAVLSFTLNSTNITQNGFTQLKANSSDIELASADSDVNFEDVKSSAFLDENVLSDLFEADSRPQVTFAVFEKSTIFDVNSSMLQYSEHNCSTSYDNQIISSVISVTTSKKIVSDSNFVKTLFRTTPVTFPFVSELNLFM